eukprot:Rhum_TRINITY_DN14788_c28_g2::Rhum_TRINITY_DN14788_c28_g2_i1::g.119248::m.119248/K14165/K14165; atypical dual specificity phosphatase
MAEEDGAGSPEVLAEQPTSGVRKMKKRPLRVKGLSFTSLNLTGEVPQFFTHVVDGKLAACAGFDPDNVQTQISKLATDHGVGGIISMTEGSMADTVMSEFPGVRFLHLPTEDLTPPTQQDMFDGVKFITEINREGRSVVVHCAKGIGRTGTMLGAYFIIVEGTSALKAIELVRDKRPGSIHKKCQEEALFALELEVHGFSTKPPDFDS